MRGLTAEQLAAGIPTEVSSAQLMALVELLGVEHEVAENVAAVELNPTRVTVTAYALEGGRRVRVSVDVRVRSTPGSRLEAWLAERDRNGSAS